MSCLLLDGNEPAKTDDIYELPATLTKQWFKTGRFGRVGTIGDGSCFFHSVCLALDLHSYAQSQTKKRKAISGALRSALSQMFTEEEYESIRKTLVSPSKKTFQEIQKMLQNPSTWADEIMIKWASKCLATNIIFLNISDNINQMYCGVHDVTTTDAIKRCEDPERPTVIVAWVDHSHFELVVRLDEITDESVTVRKAFSPKLEKDLQTIRNVMSSYAVVCKV